MLKSTKCKNEYEKKNERDDDDNVNRIRRDKKDERTKMTIVIEKKTKRKQE